MFPLQIVVLLALLSGLVFAGPEEPKKPVPKFKIGKDTTFVDGPLDADGYIDYEAALNTVLKGKSTPDTNAVVLLLKCFGSKPEGKELHPDFYKALAVAAPPEKGEYLVTDHEFFREEIRGDTAVFFELESRLRKQPWKLADSPKHAKWLERNEKPLALAVEASKRKDYHLPMIARDKNDKRGALIGAGIVCAQGCRHLASMFLTRVMLNLGDGKTEKAFADVQAIHRLGRLITRGGFLVEYLVGIALQVMAHDAELSIFKYGMPTAEQALAHQAELVNLPPTPSVAEKMKFERFLFLDSVQTSLREGFDILSFQKVDKAQGEAMAKNLDGDAILRVGNSWYDRFESALNKPTRPERVAAGVGIDKDLKAIDALADDQPSIHDLLDKAKVDKLSEKASEKIGHAYVKLFIPAIQKVADAADRAEQVHRNGIVATGLAAHFADNGRYPDALADLVPKYLTKVPGDAFNEKPLTYRKTGKGYLFYSAGTNGIDDGGKLLTDEPRGDDVGVRMPGK